MAVQFELVGGPNDGHRGEVAANRYGEPLLHRLTTLMTPSTMMAHVEKNTEVKLATAEYQISHLGSDGRWRYLFEGMRFTS